MTLKIVGSAPAQGARAVLARMVFGKDEVEFAIVDLHSWAVDDLGNYWPYVFDAVAGEPIPLEWAEFDYGGESTTRMILENKNTILSGADMDALERIVKRKDAKLKKIAASDGMKLYHQQVKTMYAQYATRNPGAPNVSSPQA